MYGVYKNSRCKEARPSRPIRCDVLIVERMRYRQTDQPTDQPTDRASYRGALSHLKTLEANGIATLSFFLVRDVRYKSLLAYRKGNAMLFCIGGTEAADGMSP